MKKFFMLFAIMSFFTLGINAQEAAPKCSKSKAACAKKCAKAKSASTAQAEVSAEQLAKFASLDETVEQKVCEKSGKVSYVRKSVCAKSGKVSYTNVNYSPAEAKFINASPSQVQGAKKCSKAQKTSCTKAQKVSCNKGAKMTKADCPEGCQKDCCKA